MKLQLPLIAIIACFGFSLSLHAADLSYTISSGTLSPSGTFTGSFLINSTTEILDGGAITATAPSGGTIYTFSHTGSDSTSPGFEIFTDGAGDMFDLALNGGLSTLALNTGTSASFLLTAGGTRYSSTGGAVTPSVSAATPEPSSLILLGTGAMAMAGSFRRRLLS